MCCSRSRGKTLLRFGTVRVKCTEDESGGKITIGVENRGRNAIALYLFVVKKKMLVGAAREWKIS
jgi:hypothetical protein